MDALEFLKALERRRNYKRGPNDGHCNWAFIYFDHRSCEELVAEVEQWAKEHPAKTRQSVFLEQYPDTIISDDELPEVAPCQLYAGLIHGESVEECENRGLCDICRREFWLQEVE